MNLRFRCLSVFILITATCSFLLSEQCIGTPQSITEQTKKLYYEIAQELDPGGSLHIVLNIEGVIEAWVNTLTQIALCSIPENQEPNPLLNALQNLPAFLKTNGFYALNGFGSSVVPIDEQQNSMKVFFSRESTAKDLPLWRALVGSDPRELAAHRYLPATTVFARSSTAELKALWALVRPAIRALAPP